MQFLKRFTILVLIAGVVCVLLRGIYFESSTVYMKKFYDVYNEKVKDLFFDYKQHTNSSSFSQANDTMTWSSSSSATRAANLAENTSQRDKKVYNLQDKDLFNLIEELLENDKISNVKNEKPTTSFVHITEQPAATSDDGQPVESTTADELPITVEPATKDGSPTVDKPATTDKSPTVDEPATPDEPLITASTTNTTSTTNNTAVLSNGEVTETKATNNTLAIPSPINLRQIFQKDGRVNQSINRNNFSQTILEAEIMNICYLQNWTAMIGQCKQKYSWLDRNNDTKLRTSSSNSGFEVVVRPIGFPSYIRITTRDKGGNDKHEGGDGWNVIVSGAAQMNVAMRDEMNGSYIGYFMLPTIGGYTIHSSLYYSMCDGLIDPPLDWFRKGTIQGKFQHDGIIDNIDAFLNDKATDIVFEVKEIAFHKARDGFCFRNDVKGCKPINTACGYWKDKKYIGFQNENSTKTPILRQPKRNLSTLWTYGDSMQVRFYKSLIDHPLCTWLFSTCRNSYTWTYEHFSANFWDDKHKYTGDDFNETKFLGDIKNVLTRKEMLTNQSVFLINFGLHTTMTLQLERCTNLFKSFLEMLTELKAIHEDHFPLVIWRTTTSPTMAHAKLKNVTHTRFLTKQRIDVWNSFTISEACKNDLPVFDLFDASTAHPYPPIDHVHHDYRTFEKARDELYEYIFKMHKL